MLQTQSKDFVITRTFDAPRELVWKCFTEPERMKEWWGPKGSTIVASNMDLRVGGSYHGAMRDPQGNVMWAKFVYREVTAPERLVWEHSFSDEAGGLTRHPLSPTWPLKLFDGGHPGGCRRRQNQADAALVTARCERGRTADLCGRTEQHARRLDRNVRSARFIFGAPGLKRLNRPSLQRPSLVAVDA